jgi:hypothetical protein
LASPSTSGGDALETKQKIIDFICLLLLQQEIKKRMVKMINLPIENENEHPGMIFSLRADSFLLIRYRINKKQLI